MKLEALKQLMALLEIEGHIDPDDRSALEARIAEGWNIAERFGWAEISGDATTGGHFIQILWWKDADTPNEAQS